MMTEVSQDRYKGSVTRWLAKAFTPALVFWIGGLIAFLSWHGFEWGDRWIRDLPAETQVIQSLIFVVIVATTAILVERLESPVLRSLQGYWPTWFDGLRQELVKRQKIKRDIASATWEKLNFREPRLLTQREQRLLVETQNRLRNTPVDTSDLMPTALGNRLRAAELRPWYRYGLLAEFCWPLLWHLLPTQARDDLVEARARLDTAVLVLIWGFLFVIWTWYAWWALPVAIVAVAWSYQRIKSHADTFSKRYETAFDLHRFLLYESLHLPLPQDSTSERELGMRLSEFLYREYPLDQTFAGPQPSESDVVIQIARADGVVIGDHTKVEQHFDRE